ncbi:hypothetical protein [Methanolobus sp.]|uniref:hypothetical protein n=1 Tax=Methanolobus sp. TaxID=1874737 RepID=UPI0025EB525B|nr:hypothetical protein [Methanolobus sp.]
MVAVQVLLSNGAVDFLIEYLNEDYQDVVEIVDQILHMMENDYDSEDRYFNKGATRSNSYYSLETKKKENNQKPRPRKNGIGI